MLIIYTVRKKTKIFSFFDRTEPASSVLSKTIQEKLPDIAGRFTCSTLGKNQLKTGVLLF